MVGVCGFLPKDWQGIAKAVGQKTVRPVITPAILKRFTAYRRLPGNAAGGSLHIVLDDKNIGTSSVQFCLEYARQHGDAEGEALAKILLAMSKTQRLKIAHRCW